MTAWRPIAIALGVLLARSADAETFEEMQGKSIGVDYQEIVSGKGSPHHVSISQRVYFSSSGQIFLRYRFSDAFGNGGSESKTESFDTVGDRQGSGKTNRTNYRWNGSSLVRNWTRKQSGVSFTETVLIDNGRCTFSRQRQNSSAAVEVSKNVCRVIRGNILSR